MEIKPEIQQALTSSGVNIEDVKKWAQSAYPAYINNDNLIARLYLQKKGVTVATPRNAGPPVPVSELKPKIWASIKVIIAAKLDTMKYVSCNDCLKSLKGVKEGEDGTCEKHGETIGRTRYWTRYIVGDDSGEVIAKFGPFDNDKEDLTGNTFTLVGVLDEYKGNVEYQVKSIAAIATDAPAAPTQQQSKSTASVTDGNVSTPASQPPALPKDVQALVEKFANIVRLYETTGEMDDKTLLGWLEKQKAAGKLPLTTEQMLDKVGYQLVDGKISKKAK